MGWQENKKAYNKQYAKENIKRVPLNIQKTDYERIKEHAEQMNETVNGFIKRAINETMINDLKPPTR